jgi:hypothetical protein
VTQWLLRKGFESNGKNDAHHWTAQRTFDFTFEDYMKLKRILSKHTVQKREAGKDTRNVKSENLLFRSSGGLCFDVCPDDKNMYGTLSESRRKSLLATVTLDTYAELKKD